MAAVRYIVQTTQGNTLGQFETVSEVENYILPRQIRAVGRQRLPRNPLVNWYHANEEYPSQIIEADYDEMIIVRDEQEEYLQRIGLDFARFERRAMIMGNWQIYPNEKEWQSNKEEKEKAHKLLLDCLNEQEKEELESFHTITINTEIGMFRINMTNLEEIIPPSFNAVYKGKRYCAVIQDSIKYPRADHFIAQLLLIKTDPEKFLKLAHKGQ